MTSIIFTSNAAENLINENFVNTYQRLLCFLVVIQFWASEFLTRKPNNMKRILLLLLAPLALVSCEKNVIKGSGNIITQTRNVAQFHSIETHYDISANIVYGPTQDVKVNGYANLLDIMESDVENGVLKLRYNNRYNRVKNGNIVATITIPVLDKATIHGSGNISVSHITNPVAFTAQIHGSGNIWIDNMLSPNIIANINGSGDIYIATSQFHNATFNIQGSGDIDARDSQVKEAVTSINGSGDIYARVADKLNATIQGSGNIYYWGQPVLQTNIQGSGRIIKR